MQNWFVVEAGGLTVVLWRFIFRKSAACNFFINCRAPREVCCSPSWKASLKCCVAPQPFRRLLHRPRHGLLGFPVAKLGGDGWNLWLEENPVCATTGKFADAVAKERLPEALRVPVAHLGTSLKHMAAQAIPPHPPSATGKPGVRYHWEVCGRSCKREDARSVAST